MHGHVRKTGIARRLRRNATAAEQRLWYRLRSRSLYGMKLVRQQPVGPCIVDFVCRECRLIVEVDGGQHCEDARDVVRDQWLRDHGYRVLRFSNDDVLKNIEGVLEVAATTLPRDGRAPSPPLGGEGRGEGGGRQGHTTLASPTDVQSPSSPKGREGGRCGKE